MRFRLLVCIMAACLAAATARAAEWRVERIDAPARVTGIETVNGEVRAYSGELWYILKRRGDEISFAFSDLLTWPQVPDEALPGSKLAVGRHDIARAWLTEPTDRYNHGILGDKIEAGTLVIETRDGMRHPIRLKADAVFEDLEPRIADLDGNDRDDVIAVKSYLKRGSALAVIGERRGKYEIVAETPPLGAPYRWLDPISVADFTGGGHKEIALVRQPHEVGTLELWDWHDGHLHKIASLPDTANHIAGSRAMDMSAVADFDGDGVADIAIPSLDRGTLRIVSFAPKPREIAAIKLPAKAVTNLGLLPGAEGSAVVLGLADGSLVWLRKVP